MTLAAALSLLLAAPGSRCVEIAALSDLHGHVETLPAVGTHVQALRRAGPTLLLDAGDSLQGTIEANLSRGAVVVAGYGALRLDASAVGNHDFDYGQEVLKARMSEASYPFLSANLRVASTGERPAWPNLEARRTLHPAEGPVVGVFGLSGEDTPYTTMPRNVGGLSFEDAAREARAQAVALRAEGAELVVALVHIGGHCADLSAPEDLSSCDRESDLFRLVEALPAGAVDAVVAGHTHALVNHRVAGVPVLQAGARAEVLGRLTVCAGSPARFHRFLPLRGRGAPAPDPAVAAAVAPFLAAARAERERPLGVALRAPLTRDRGGLSSFGAATASSLRAALGADFGLANAGALRVDLPAGPLTQGQLYEALPFDDDLAVFKIKGIEVEALFRALTRSGKGFPQAAGLRYGPDGVRSCAGDPLDPGKTYTVATNEFLAEGGDGVRAVVKRFPPGSTVRHHEIDMRGAFLRWLKATPADRLTQVCP
jgi:5'-nucleotidase